MSKCPGPIASILSILNLEQYSFVEKILISNCIKYLLVRYEEKIENINDKVIKKAIENNKNYTKDKYKETIKIIIEKV